MSVEQIAAWAAAIVSIITAIGALLTALRASNKVDADGVTKTAELQQVRRLVDARITEALNGISSLRSDVSDLAERSVAQVKKVDDITVEEPRQPG